MNITMSPQQPMLSVTKAIPFQSGIFADVWRTNIQVAGYRYSTQGFYNLSDSAYSRMSGYTVKPPTGDTNEQTQFIDYFNLFYSKRGQEQISISQQLGNYGTTFFSASRQSYWNTSRSDQQISFGLNVPFGDITTSLNYSYSNNIWQNDRDHLLAFTLNVPFSHWMRTDSQSAFRNSNASYSMSNDLKGGMTNHLTVLRMQKIILC